MNIVFFILFYIHMIQISKKIQNSHLTTIILLYKNLHMYNLYEWLVSSSWICLATPGKEKKQL